MTEQHARHGQVHAVIFDWGGTLTPWHEVDLSEQWRVFAREVHGVPFGSPDVLRADLDEAHLLAEKLMAVEAAAWRKGREANASARINDILEEAGLDPEHDRQLLALAAYQRFWEPHTHTDPHVLPLWTWLREQGIKVGVLSNTIWTRDYHRGVFARDGVLHLIDADLYSSEIEHVKPAPEAFQAICAALGVEPEFSVYVGDRLFEDVHGPQQIGMRAILIPHSDLPDNQRVAVDAIPDAIAHQLSEIAGIISSWQTH